MIHNSTLRLLMTGAAVLSLSGPALALDGAAVIEKLNAAYAYSGGEITYDSVDTDGDTVTLSGAGFKATAGGQSAKIGDVTMEGVEETDDGGYYVETVSFPDVNVNEDQTIVTAKDLQLSGLTIPGDPSASTIDSIVLYESASSGPINVNVKGKDVFSVSETSATITRQDGDAGFDFDADLMGIKANLSEVEDAKARDTIQKLGLTEVSGEIGLKGSWTLADGKVTLDEYAFDFANIGKLNLSLDISGYTLEFMKALQEATKTAQAQAGGANAEQANQALGLAMMGLVQQLTFNGASIRFEDDSITTRLLEYFGNEQGVSGEQMAQSIKGMAPLMLAQLNIPELQNQIASAVNAYLDDPQSLTISADPANPVPFPMIMGAAMGAPNTIPQVLGVTVSAND